VASVDPPGRSLSAADPTPPGGTGVHARSPVRSLVEWVGVIGGALVLAFVIRTFLLAAFYIPSESMLDTLEVGDRVLVNKLSYRLHDVNRGDVVVFERPPNQPDSGIKDLIKRVIGLPGDTLEGRACQIYVTPAGSQETLVLQEPYLDRGWTQRCDFGPVTLGSEQLWVMGDNRDDSEDSRFFGPIDDELVVGRAFVVVWPLSHLGWL
jgi:signal peptidase I